MGKLPLPGSTSASPLKHSKIFGYQTVETWNWKKPYSTENQFVLFMTITVGDFKCFSQCHPLKRPILVKALGVSIKMMIWCGIWRSPWAFSHNPMKLPVLKPPQNSSPEKAVRYLYPQYYLLNIPSSKPSICCYRYDREVRKLQWRVKGEISKLRSFSYTSTVFHSICFKFK